MIDLAPYIENQIRIQQEAIESHKRWVKYLIIGGIAIIVISLIIDTLIYLKTGKRESWGLADFLKLGGTFVGVVAAFPYKDIPPKKALVMNFKLLKDNCQDWGQLPAAEHQFCIELVKIVVGQAPK